MDNSTLANGQTKSIIKKYKEGIMVHIPIMAQGPTVVAANISNSPIKRATGRIGSTNSKLLSKLVFTHCSGLKLFNPNHFQVAEIHKLPIKHCERIERNKSLYSNVLKRYYRSSCLGREPPL